MIEIPFTLFIREVVLFDGPLVEHFMGWLLFSATFNDPCYSMVVCLYHFAKHHRIYQNLIQPPPFLSSSVLRLLT